MDFGYLAVVAHRHSCSGDLHLVRVLLLAPLHAHAQLKTLEIYIWCVPFYSFTQHVPDTCRPSPRPPPTLDVTVIRCVLVYSLSDF